MHKENVNGTIPSDGKLSFRSIFLLLPLRLQLLKNALKKIPGHKASTQQQGATITLLKDAHQGCCVTGVACMVSSH